MTLLEDYLRIRLKKLKNKKDYLGKYKQKAMHFDFLQASDVDGPKLLGPHYWALILVKPRQVTYLMLWGLLLKFNFSLHNPIEFEYESYSNSIV